MSKRTLKNVTIYHFTLKWKKNIRKPSLAQVASDTWPVVNSGLLALSLINSEGKEGIL